MHMHAHYSSGVHVLTTLMVSCMPPYAANEVAVPASGPEVTVAGPEVAGLEGGVGKPLRSMLVRWLSLSRTASTGSNEEFFVLEFFTGLSFLF